jgi:hypothetical protein
MSKLSILANRVMDSNEIIIYFFKTIFFNYMITKINNHKIEHQLQY